MHVGIGLVNVADAESIAGFRHQLHQADGAHPAMGVLIEPGFLIALRLEQERIEAVFARTLPEDFNRIAKTLDVGTLSRAMQLLQSSQV
jgi:hypothetical protein